MGDVQPSNHRRKRNRLVMSCVPCHERHIKCSRTLPCLSCIQSDRGDSCHFSNTMPTATQPLSHTTYADIPVGKSLSTFKAHSSRHSGSPIEEVIELGDSESAFPINRKDSAGHLGTHIKLGGRQDGPHRPFSKFLSEVRLVRICSIRRIGYVLKYNLY